MMKKLITTCAVLMALVAPVAAESGSDAHAACVFGWAALAAENGAKTAKEAGDAGWRHCRHIKNKGMESDREFYLNDVIAKIFKGFKND